MKLPTPEELSEHSPGDGGRTFSKDDKWMLASHLQKAIRRGWADEAAWAAQHLHGVDRAYLAYRMSVIAVEDVGAGDPEAMASYVSSETPWGAKRFGPTKTEEDSQNWAQTAHAWAQLTKDRTPCDWMACRWWLPEFEAQYGSWAALSPEVAVVAAYDTTLTWWQRGLMAWRAAGTDKFPADGLPEMVGVWDLWVARAPTDAARTVMVGLGARQREAHPVFFPLAVHDRIHDSTAARVVSDVGAPIKVGPWLAVAMDKHTADGSRALHRFFKSQSPAVRQELIQRVGQQGAIDVLGQLMFWMEGGRVDQQWRYGTMSVMDSETKKRWLQHHKLSGRALFDTWGKPHEWNAARGVSNSARSPSGP